MGRQLVLAYTIAGIAVAVAITAVSASTLGLTGGSSTGPSEGMVTTASAGGVEGLASAEASIVGADGVEYVYVDGPAAPRWDDDEGEHDEHDDYEEHEEEGEHEGGGGLLFWLNGGDDDDD